MLFQLFFVKFPYISQEAHEIKGFFLCYEITEHIKYILSILFMMNHRHPIYINEIIYFWHAIWNKMEMISLCIGSIFSKLSHLFVAIKIFT
jgi:hypothetical protein